MIDNLLLPVFLVITLFALVSFLAGYAIGLSEKRKDYEKKMSAMMAKYERSLLQPHGDLLPLSKYPLSDSKKVWQMSPQELQCEVDAGRVVMETWRIDS